tara:strand:- start:157 stop:453 length:297 start_codon:yes stop_codon:yes gene_type:complete
LNHIIPIQLRFDGFKFEHDLVVHDDVRLDHPATLTVEENTHRAFTIEGYPLLAERDAKRVSVDAFFVPEAELAANLVRDGFDVDVNHLPVVSGDLFFK